MREFNCLAEREDPVLIDPKDHDYAAIAKLMIGTIVPRPIAFVSTVSENGVFNLAPFSYFNGVSSNPPIVMFSSVIRRDGQHKDTYNNVSATKDFVINIVSEHIAEQMNICSEDLPPGVDEFAESRLTPVTSNIVKAPRVFESRVNMECKLVKIVDFGDKPGSGSAVFGEVVMFHIADEIINDLKIDPDKLRAIGRMGGAAYLRTHDRFVMTRPKS